MTTTNSENTQNSPSKREDGLFTRLTYGLNQWWTDFKWEHRDIAAIAIGLAFFFVIFLIAMYMFLALTYPVLWIGVALFLARFIGRTFIP